MLNWRNLECSGNLGAHRDAATMRSAQFPNKISPILLNPPCPSASVRTPENLLSPSHKDTEKVLNNHNRAPWQARDGATPGWPEG